MSSIRGARLDRGARRRRRAARPAALTTARCTGAILAGGAASRFGGRPKGLERLGARSIVERVRVALASATDGVLLVANDPDAGDWLPGVEVVRDVHPGQGPLAGIHAALVARQAPVLAVAWDMPFVTGELLLALRQLGETRATIAVAEGPGGIEPLCGYYPLASLEPLEAALAAGQGGARRFVEGWPGLALLTAHEVARFGDPARLLASVNDPADLEAARRVL